MARNGNWGSWSPWTVCDRGCGGGKRSRHRFCDNPVPAHGGNGCQGDRNEVAKCNTQPCPGELTLKRYTQYNFCLFGGCLEDKRNRV